MSWVAWPLKNFKITALLVTLLTAFGLYSMYVMPKDEFPPYVIRQGVVIAVNPGATSEEIMRLCEDVRKDVKKTFGVDIHPEVNII